MKTIQSSPRLIVELPEDLHNEMNKLLPWGVKSHIIRILCEDLVAILRKNPDKALGALMARAVKLEDFPAFKELQDGDNQ
jgi:hypothetical protein